jgi:hypothetical protein
MSATTNILPTVREVSTTPRPEELRDFTRSMRAFMDRNRAEVRVSYAAEAADVRRFTVQVVDRSGRAITKSLWTLMVMFGTNARGLPSGTQTVTLVTGTLIQTISTHQCVMVATDEYGKAEFDVEVTGAGTRYVTGVVLGEIQPPTAGVVWA